jgi:hypothetical protein
MFRVGREKDRRSVNQIIGKDVLIQIYLVCSAKHTHVPDAAHHAAYSQLRQATSQMDLALLATQTTQTASG